LLLLATSLSITAYIRQKKKKRSCWTRSWLVRRVEHSIGSTLVQELSVEDKPEYRSMFRMTEQDFNYLPNLVTPMITKQDTLFRECISDRERLQITLLYLATGKSNDLDCTGIDININIGINTGTIILYSQKMHVASITGLPSLPSHAYWADDTRSSTPSPAQSQ